MGIRGGQEGRWCGVMEDKGKGYGREIYGTVWGDDEVERFRGSG